METSLDIDSLLEKYQQTLDAFDALGGDDFENLNSLKNLINSHKGALLIITHNRYLLNHCFNKILHIENMELQEFDGRYIDYNFSLLQSKIELQELAHADTEEIERNDILIDKFRDTATINADASN